VWFLLLIGTSWLLICAGIGLFAARKLRAVAPHPFVGPLVIGGAAAAVLLLPLFIIVGLFLRHSSDAYTARLPPAFEVDELAKVERGTLCRMAAYHYAEATHRAVREGGLAWLNAGPRTRLAGGSGRRYAPWEPTPRPDIAQELSGSRWSRSFPCLKDHGNLRREVVQALGESGAYYTHLERNSKTGLLLVPSRRLIVYLVDAS
jgi:hypothetical protein